MPQIMAAAQSSSVASPAHSNSSIIAADGGAKASGPPVLVVVGSAGGVPSNAPKATGPKSVATSRAKMPVKSEPGTPPSAAAGPTPEQAAAIAASFKKLNRFSDIEKSMLYAQFKEHQQIIDIKQRRSSYSSHKQAEVRACWERIVDEYNAHPDTQNRTMRQIQKFWLNSKLRNQIPSDDNPAVSPRAVKPKADVRSVAAAAGGPSSGGAVPVAATMVKRTIKNDGTIVPTITTYTIQSLQMEGSSDGEVIEHHPHMQHVQQQHAGGDGGVGSVEAGETVEMMQEDEEEILDDEDSVEHVADADMLAESEDGGVEDMIELKFIDAQQQQAHHQQQQQQQQETTHRVQVHENGTASLQLVGTTDRTEFGNLDQIEMITSHDYSTTTGSSAVDKQQRRLFCGSDCGTERDPNEVLDSHHNTHHHQHQHHQNHQHQTEQHHQQQHHHHSHQHTTVLDEGTATVVVSGGDGSDHHVDHQQQSQHSGYAEQMNELRLQEAQCRLKESELRCELQQLAVQRAQEELRQMRELHVLNINEMQLKLDKMKKELRLSMA